MENTDVDSSDMVDIIIPTRVVLSPWVNSDILGPMNLPSWNGLFDVNIAKCFEGLSLTVVSLSVTRQE